jgi:hypothetical protein
MDESLHHQPLSAFRPLFASLIPPEISALNGTYRAEFTGPWWLRKTAGPSLALAHFRGWWGKQFTGGEDGSNLFLRDGQIKPLFSFKLALLPSLVDGKPSAVVQYLQTAPFPWYFVRDELRWLDQSKGGSAEGCLLGLTIINKGFLSRLAFPFILMRQDH